MRTLPGIGPGGAALESPPSGWARNGGQVGGVRIEVYRRRAKFGALVRFVQAGGGRWKFRTHPTRDAALAVAAQAREVYTQLRDAGEDHTREAVTAELVRRGVLTEYVAPVPVVRVPRIQPVRAVDPDRPWETNCISQSEARRARSRLGIGRRRGRKLPPMTAEAVGDALLGRYDEPWHRHPDNPGIVRVNVRDSGIDAKLILDIDNAKLLQHPLYFSRKSNGSSEARITIDGVKRHLAEYILGHKPRGSRVVAFANGDPLDYRRCNIEIVERSVWKWRRRIATGDWSGSVRPCRRNKLKPWKAQIVRERKQMHLGYYRSKAKATEAVKAAVIEIIRNEPAAPRPASALPATFDRSLSVLQRDRRFLKPISLPAATPEQVAEALLGTTTPHQWEVHPDNPGVMHLWALEEGKDVRRRITIDTKNAFLARYPWRIRDREGPNIFTRAEPKKGRSKTKCLSLGRAVLRFDTSIFYGAVRRNGNPFDYREANLIPTRLCDLNRHGTKPRSNNTSGYRNVSFVASKVATGRPYRAAIFRNGQVFFLGMFVTAEEAAEAVRTARAELGRVDGLDAQRGAA